MQTIIANIEGKGKLEFTKADDGWYEYIPPVDERYGIPVGNGYAINPELTMCQTYPWEADYICDAPEHKIISIE